MLRERNAYPKLTTPTGEAIWPAIKEPDFRYKKEFGEFHVRLRFDPATPGLDEIVAEAEKILDEAFEAKKTELTRLKKGAILRELKKAPILKPELDRETGEETGFVILRAAANAGGKKRDGGGAFTKRIDVFNRKGEQLRSPPEPGSGSKLKLSVRPMDYETDGGKTIGVRFELEGVQIITLVQGGSRSASDYGFAEEDGDDVYDEPVREGGASSDGDVNDDDKGDF